ncbi:hypothetical protein [Photobacterium halotolerans]|uniref:Uncharacterized protein n=1 Tax=Photobacterium halotolerans TaxID=265726 RepID=A0A0F5VCB2_9GAMM|nr:hypothetical protein [Photobacterium halotolerans]KKC99104.1 hypothetical protein KY46_14795 [Photobacterium halotolerans]
MEKFNTGNDVKLMNLDLAHGRKYIRDYLDGQNGFQKKLIETIRSRRFSCKIIVPETYHMTHQINLNCGGVFSQNLKENQHESGVVKVIDSSLWLSCFIKELLKEDHLSCLFDDVMTNASEFMHGHSHGFIYHDFAYHFVSQSMIDSEKDILSLIYATKLSWHFLCVLFDAEIDCIEDIDRFISEVLDNFQVLILGIFDGESYLVMRADD